jgi:hypothetical protein
MKPTTLRYVVLMALYSLFLSCSPSKPLPPGQQKKVSGSKSAKPYAPGQQKKNH